jgi:hypothetical protein
MHAQGSLRIPPRNRFLPAPIYPSTGRRSFVIANTASPKPSAIIIRRGTVGTDSSKKNVARTTITTPAIATEAHGQFMADPTYSPPGTAQQHAACAENMAWRIC